MYLISYQTIAAIMALVAFQYLCFVVWQGAPTPKWRFAGLLATAASWALLAHLIVSVPHASAPAAPAGSSRQVARFDG